MSSGARRTRLRPPPANVGSVPAPPPHTPGERLCLVPFLAALRSSTLVDSACLRTGPPSSPHPPTTESCAWARPLPVACLRAQGGGAFSSGGVAGCRSVGAAEVRRLFGREGWGGGGCQRGCRLASERARGGGVGGGGGWVLCARLRRGLRTACAGVLLLCLPPVPSLELRPPRRRRVASGAPPACSGWRVSDDSPPTGRGGRLACGGGGGRRRLLRKRPRPHGHRCLLGLSRHLPSL